MEDGHKNFPFDNWFFHFVLKSCNEVAWRTKSLGKFHSNVGRKQFTVRVKK